MQLSKLTFLLVNLVLISALTFVVMPAMAADGGPRVTIMEYSGTDDVNDPDDADDHVQERADFRVKLTFTDPVVLGVDARTAFGVNDNANEVKLQAAKADGLVDGLVGANKLVEIDASKDGTEYVATWDSSAISDDATKVVITFGENIVVGTVNAVGIGNQPGRETFTLPPLLAAVKVALSDVMEVEGKAGRFSVTFTFTDTAAKPPVNVAPTSRSHAFMPSHIAIMPEGLATVVNDDGTEKATEITVGTVGDELGVGTAEIQLGYFPPGGPSSVTVGVDPGYATMTGSAIQLPPPAAPPAAEAPRATIEVMNLNTDEKTFRIDITFVPADGGEAVKTTKFDGTEDDPRTSIVRILEITDRDDAEVIVNVYPSGSSRRRDNHYTAILQYDSLARLPFTIKINQDQQKTSNEDYEYTVPEPVTNTAPTFGSEEIADISVRVGEPISEELPEARDADGDTITYTLTPTELPDGVEFDPDPAARMLSGAPEGPMAMKEYTYTANDGTVSTELMFYITVNANNVPTFGSEEIADVTAREGMPIVSVTLPEATDDDDDDTLTYELSPALPDGLRFVKSTRELSGTPEGPMAMKKYTYTASDGAASAELMFYITVDANNVPTFDSATIADVTAREGMPIVSVTLPEATDDDDDDTLTYTLSPALPDGLRFVKSTRELSGTPEGPMATKKYTYTADDGTASAELMFYITVNADNAPTFDPGTTIAPLIATVGTATTKILPTATDADGDTITYTLSPAPPVGLTFNAATQLISGTPSAVTVAPAVYTYTATAGRKSDSLRFTIQVNAAVAVIPTANRVPVFPTGSSIADIHGTVGTAIPVQALPIATDPDGDTVTYTLSPQLPAGLTYSRDVLSGTPTEAMEATRYIYRASDGNGGQAVLAFIIQVAAAPPSVPELPGTAQIDGPAISLPAATIGPNEFIVLQRNPKASGIYSEVNSVTVGFANLDHLFRDRGGMVLSGSGSANDLVFSEIMWGSDSSLSVPEHSQWIELYNTTSQTLQLSNYRLQFYSSSITGTAGAIDEINTNGWSSLHGQSGRTQGTDTQGLFSEPVEIISMYLKINYPRVERSQARGEQLKDFRDGSNHGHWAASARPSLKIAGTWRLATPGMKPRFMIHGASSLRQEVLISEFGNSSEDDYDWIELYNTTDKVINLKKWELSYVYVENGVGKEKSLFRFPDNDSHRLPPKSFLVVASSDPKKSGNDLAAGIDITKRGVDQQGKGLGTWIGGGSGDDKNINALYTVRPFSLPNGTARMNIILRHDQGKLGKASHFEDVVGTLKVELRGPVVSGWTGYDANSETYFNTAFWPLHATGGPHGNVINHTGDEDFRAGRVYQRQDLGKGVRTGINENKLAIRGWTGIGYDLQADRNNENGGTPGYHKDSLKSKASEVAGDVSISEIMLATGTEEDIRPAATRLPQWIELYNASSTQGVNINNWYLELHNSNLDRDLNLSGTLRLPNITIPPNQTVMIVSNSALNSGNFSEARTINLYTNGTYRNTLNLRSRGDSVLSQEGFYIEIRDHENKHVDEIGNLGVSRRTGIASRGDAAEIWELPSLHSEDGHRTSLIRVYDDRTNQPGDGLLAESWRRASDTNFRNIPSLTYFGNHRDFGTPGYRGGGPLPVALSKFRPERLETGEVVVRWVTESELNNAGFNILRTEKKEGVFEQVNPELIKGQGTTSGRNAYKWTDTTAKPNVVYYYQIQDVSLDGQVQTLRISRLKGNISAAGKATTTWGRLKARD